LTQVWGNWRWQPGGSVLTQGRGNEPRLVLWRERQAYRQPLRHLPRRTSLVGFDLA
jgi:hypothetical protein